jgi:K+-sensing histidine kinase KdpD
MDDILFEQVVRNLVDNAIRHSGNEEPVLIHGRLEDRGAEARSERFRTGAVRERQ